MKKTILFTALITTALTSCAVGPDYEQAQPEVNSAWSIADNINIEAPSGAATANALKVKVDGLEAVKAKSNINQKPEAVKAEDTKTEEPKPVDQKNLEEPKAAAEEPKPEAKLEEEPQEEVILSETIHESPVVLASFDGANWWENFNDTTLNDLIVQAVEQNKDLKIAQARVKEARGNRLSSGAILLPQVNVGADASRSNQRSTFSSKPINTYQYGFDASWEIDLFGGNRRRYEAADDLVEASESDEKDVLITLRAEVARNYVEVRNFQNQIRITEDNIRSQEESFGLTKSQRDAGLVSDLDVSQAESLFYATKSRLPSLKTSAEGAKNNLAILLAKQPGQLDELLDKEGSVPVAAKQFIIDTPATAIANRPDVKSTERNLAAATALQGAAIAELFPKISLTSFFGYQDSSLIKGGNLWSLGGSTFLPLLDFGRVRGQINVADAQQEQQLNLYQRTVLEALAEVQTNLVAYINEEQRRESLFKAVESNKNAVKLSKQRYDTGISAFTDVLIAQRELYEVQSQLAESEAAVARTLIALNKSLGR